MSPKRSAATEVGAGDEQPPAGDASDTAGDSGLAIRFCPHCGEPIGSFWGRRGDDGSHWCESCQAFFRVEQA